MSRGDGFPIADVDVGILDDPKVRALVRSTTDEGLAARCVTAYLSVITASWGAGERLPLVDAAPLWLTLDDIGGRLAEAGLTDADGRIPQATWDRWYGPAWARKQARVEAGKKGGLTGGKGRPKQDSGVALGDAQAKPNPNRSVPFRSEPNRTEPITPIRSVPNDRAGARRKTKTEKYPMDRA